MKSGTKLIIVAVLALLTGTAFASPLLIYPLDTKPFPRVPEGPEASFTVDLVYANFSVQADTVTYMVVLNITNLSEIEAKISDVSFAAAQSVSVVPSALGGSSFARAEGPGVDFGGVVEGVWLDNEWINVTWIPGTDYPFNLIRVISPNHNTTTIVPELPANATEEGTWIEGVPIAEYYNSTAMTSTSIYINGAWVDVTGRVRADPEQPMVMATNTLVNSILVFGGEHYRNIGNASVGPITALPSWHTYNGNGPAIQWKEGGFDNTWMPHQSRLIAFMGTQPLGINFGITALASEKITLYAAASAYVNDWLVNGTYYDTLSTATWLKQVQLEKTANWYIYTNVLNENQMFNFDQFGVEVFIK